MPTPPKKIPLDTSDLPDADARMFLPAGEHGEWLNVISLTGPHERHDWSTWYRLEHHPDSDEPWRYVQISHNPALRPANDLVEEHVQFMDHAYEEHLQGGYSPETQARFDAMQQAAKANRERYRKMQGPGY